MGEFRVSREIQELDFKPVKLFILFFFKGESEQREREREERILCVDAGLPFVTTFFR